MNELIYPTVDESIARRRRELAVETRKAFSAFSKQAFAEGALSAKFKQLIAVAVAHVTQCPYCIDAHTQLAVKYGASDEEIMEAIWIAAEMRAGGAFAHSALALRAIEKARTRFGGSKPPEERQREKTADISGDTTVRDLVGHYPQTQALFEQHGIDYCCGGDKRLAEVAKEHGLELSVLIDDLKDSLRNIAGEAWQAEKNWYAVPLGELAHHIVEAHHGYLREALPRLRSLVPKVLRAHGAQHGEVLRQVQDLFNALDSELSDHIVKEEQVLFPYIASLEAHAREGAAKPFAPFGSARNPIGQMEHEHESAGAALAKLREITQNYSLPADACPTFKAMYEELQRLEDDLHEHIHLENNILFPRTIELEEALGRQG